MKKHHISAFCFFVLGAATAFAQVQLNAVPSRTVGHPQTPTKEQNQLYSANPNLVEGRELFQPMGIVVDASMSPPALYVADTGNNRVLGWRNALGYTTGQKADIVIGQTNLFTTHPQGPGRDGLAPGQTAPLQSGLTSPSGLAVRNGDLYVVDTGNNRILRFPKPFDNADHLPDMVIGQPNLSYRGANYSSTQVNAQGLSYTSGSSLYPATIAFDADGNLWAADPANRRVLRFARADIETSPSYGATANLELGQLDFTSARSTLSPSNAQHILTKDQFAVPSGLGFDAQGRLYVTDADPNSPGLLSRVLVFLPPFNNGMAATRIMGIVISGSGLTTTQMRQTVMNDPSGVLILPNNQGIGIVDSGYSRILFFAPYEQWSAEGVLFSPMAVSVAGHAHSLDFDSLNGNNASTTATYIPRPNASVFYGPGAAYATNTEVYVADTYNNRVLAMLYQGGTAPALLAATRVLGQDAVDASAINLVEGRELNFASTGDAGVAFDIYGDTPKIYIADSGNNRVLGYRDARKLAAGAAADLIIGQANAQGARCNDSGDPDHPNSSTLCQPTGVLVDANGDLWVADLGNSRVLRFAAPFAQTGRPVANLVLGQTGFTGKVTDATARTMSQPYGLAMTYDGDGKPTGSLLVSDRAHNRVLVFERAAGSFSNGQAASKVIGQHTFNSTEAGSDNTSLNAPRHITVDTDTRVYVADSGNSRIAIFPPLSNVPSTDASAVYRITGINAPRGVYVSPVTGEIWVTSNTSSTARALRYPRFDDVVTGQSSNLTISMPSAVLALVQDDHGAMAAADASSRVALYFPQLAAQNAANFLSTTVRALAPGTWASVYTDGEDFSSSTAGFSAYPLPTDLADVQVMLNDAAAFLSYVSPRQINIYIPMSAPAAGFADLEVVRKSSGRVLGAIRIPMSDIAPAIFLNDANTTAPQRQVAALNHDDGSVNSPSNAAKRGSYIEIYATGAGAIQGAPDNGNPAPLSGPLYHTPSTPRVFLGSCFLDDAGCTMESGNLVQYSGLAPGLVGVWQINVKIPQNTTPGSQVPLLVLLNSVPNAGLAVTGYSTTIAVKNP